MTPFNLVHDFDADPARFWKVFFHEPYNVELYERIKVKERKILDWKETDDTIYRVIKIVPARDLPGFMKKIIGGDLGYVETSTFYKAKDSMDIAIEPTLMRDRTKMKALYKLDATGPNKVRRSFSGSITVDFPLIGRKVEEFVIADMARGYDIAATVTREWLAKPDF